ncbi:MAG: tRNA lysidine(34) synthetase TilS [Burkholderiaceae bacterium]
MTRVAPAPEPPTAQVVAVAYSGGRDSSALLHATLAAAAPLSLRVFAFHVHHGLSPHADAWLAFCNEQCARWARRGWRVAFAAERLAEAPPSGDSIEAWAREQRYRALHDLAKRHGVELILLAHHRLDQAETFLLQALRGAGVSGLAGMPRFAQRDGLIWARPWLDRPREAIDAYLRRHRLRFIDDHSNADPRYARNRLRIQVWPVFAHAFPQAEASIAQSAAWAQQASLCLEELATIDLLAVASDRGFELRAWKALSEARRSNVLRAWLKNQLGRAASASLVTRLLAELDSARSASWPCPDGNLRLYREVLVFRRHLAAPTESVRETQLCVRRAGVYKLPGWLGQVRVQRTPQGGVPLAWLGQVELRSRAGGEQFQAGLGRPPRSLKKQYQAASVPPWLREGPLFFSGGQLVFVPGLGVDARALALPGQPQVTLEWQRLSDRAR